MLKKIVFTAFLVGFVVAIVEGCGYGLFLLKFGQTPHAWGDEHFKTSTLLMPDHPYLPYLPTPGRNGVVEFNSLGDRGPEPETPKRRVRVLCFGGSTTFDQAHAWDETWPGVLQAMLGRDRYEVINAAQNGGTTADTLVNLALLHLDLAPDYVLAYEGTNDLESSYARGFRPDYAHRRKDIERCPYPFFERLPRWLDYSSFYVLTRRALAGDRGDLWSLYTRAGSTYDFEHGPFGLETFRRNLLSINALCKTVGATLVLGTFQYYRPWAQQHNGIEFADAWQRGLDRENDIIRALPAADRNIRVAEVARSFTPGEKEMTDFCHLTAEGNRKIAAAFLEAIRAAPRR